MLDKATFEATFATWAHTPSPKVEQMIGLLRERGKAQYGGERVSQLEHALQCAHLAERAGACAPLVAAALMHDVGHLLHWRGRQPDGRQADDHHETVAAYYLSFWFPGSVVEPVRLHVAAKRYLCAAAAGYRDRLSAESLRSLALQGGPMTAAEANEFLLLPFSQDAIAVRAWDDEAKIPHAQTPPLNHFRQFLEAALLASA